MKDECIEWIRSWFEKNGNGCKAIIGMSGGKDSTIVAALCKEALGAENVIGVAMPDDGQATNDADAICQYLGIKYLCVPIGSVTYEFKNLNDFIDVDFSEQAEQNMPPRVRMTLLYMISQTYKGRVACTCNASERYIGYETIWGDSVGDFCPIADLTVTEVKNIGYELGLPKEWVDKTPDDGLPHSSPDEEKLGFTYNELDNLMNGNKVDVEKAKKIDNMHNKALFKINALSTLPYFSPSLHVYLN